MKRLKQISLWLPKNIVYFYSFLAHCNLVILQQRSQKHKYITLGSSTVDPPKKWKKCFRFHIGMRWLALSTLSSCREHITSWLFSLRYSSLEICRLSVTTCSLLNITLRIRAQNGSFRKQLKKRKEKKRKKR